MNTASCSRSVLIMAVVTALVLPTGIAALYFVALAGSGERNLLQQGVYAGGKIVQFSLPVLFVLLCERRWPQRPASLWAGVLPGVIFGLVAVGGMLALYAGWLRHSPLLTDTPAKVAQKVREMGVGTPARYLALALFLSAIHSLLEEYYWRWFVFGRLRELLPRGPAVVISALGFMSHHVIIVAVFFPGRILEAVVPLSGFIALGGAFWAYLYDRSGSLLGPWLGHVLIDAGLFAIGWDLIRRGLS